MNLAVVNHKDYFAKIGDDHKFPINKFGDLADYLIKEKIVKKFHKPYPCSLETLKKAHSEEYINNIKNKTLDEISVKKIGFPLVDSVVKRSFIATGGTVLASKLAINYGVACNTAGGSHHANYNGGAGYCVFNDVAVASHYLLDRGLAGKILIVDLDVHQGNGNSDIFKDNRKNILEILNAYIENLNQFRLKIENENFIAPDDTIIHTTKKVKRPINTPKLTENELDQNINFDQNFHHFQL